MKYQLTDINYSALLTVILAHGLIVRIAFIFPIFKLFVGGFVIFEGILTLMYFHETKSPIALVLLVFLAFVLVMGA